LNTSTKIFDCEMATVATTTNVKMEQKPTIDARARSAVPELLDLADSDSEHSDVAPRAVPPKTGAPPARTCPVCAKRVAGSSLDYKRHALMHDERRGHLPCTRGCTRMFYASRDRLRAHYAMAHGRMSASPPSEGREAVRAPLVGVYAVQPSHGGDASKSASKSTVEFARLRARNNST